jgi:1,4-dihydroxy-2-naphthoyl-CoA synthase
VAQRIRDLVCAAGRPVADAPERGLDHGAYIPLLCIYPAADIPVLHVSLPSEDPRELYKNGRAVAPMRDEGVLLIGSWFLTQIVGTARARDLYLRPRVISADEALALGLATEVVDDDALQARALAFAHELANGPRVTLGYMKENLNFALHGTLEAALDLEALHHTMSAVTDDHKEAAAAFVEKRDPKFAGR